MGRRLETGSLSGHVSGHGVVSPWRGGARLTGAPGWLLLDAQPEGHRDCGWGGAAPWCRVVESPSLP